MTAALQQCPGMQTHSLFYTLTCSLIHFQLIFMEFPQIQIYCMRTRDSEQSSVIPFSCQQFPCCGSCWFRISTSGRLLCWSGYPIPAQAFATPPVSCGLCQRKLRLPVATVTLLNSAQPPTQTIAKRAENALVTAVFSPTSGYNKGYSPLLEKIHRGESAWNQFKRLDWFQGLSGGGKTTTITAKTHRSENLD